MAPIPFRSKKVIFGVAFSFGGGEGGKEVAAGLKPAGNVVKQAGMFGAGQVKNDVKGCYRVKTFGGEIQPHNIAMKKSCLRQVLAGKPNLLGGNIYPGEDKAFGKLAAKGDSRPTANIQRRGAVGQLIFEPAQRGEVAFGAGLGIGLGARIVSGGDQALPV